jgi:hypothetical protein
MEERVNEGRTKGRKHSPETRAKISATVSARQKGRRLSPETRAKISAALKKGRKGPKRSPETRAKGLPSNSATQ